jgi:hypothetical protein
MAWRLLLLLCKSALVVALLELLSPVASAIGLQLPFLDTMATAVAHSTALPYREAEALFLFVLVTTLLEVTQFLWALLVG